MRILLISSVLPSNTSGGELTLYRHFDQLPSGWEVAIASESESTRSVITIKPSPIWVRLTKTRLAKLAHSFTQCINPLYSIDNLTKWIKNNRPDLIMTVAHGELCWVALNLAKKYKIPLVTFFHDWWPNLAFIPHIIRPYLSTRFKLLYQESNLAFCVSESMEQALGKHPNSVVLYPISAQLNIKQSVISNNQLQLIYAGSLSGVYAPMLQKLVMIKDARWNLKLLGPAPFDWSKSLQEFIRNQKIYSGFVEREILIEQLSQADLLLVVISFDPKDKIRVQTSFPSKLIEYCQFGKPIIIWGPTYSSAVQWSYQYESALVVNSSEPNDLIESIIRAHPDQLKSLGKKALLMSQTIFNPGKIQESFINNLTTITKRN